MKSNRIGNISLLALSLLFTTNGAFAQSPARADVPFAFSVGTKHLPAGTYEIKRADFDSKIVMVSNRYTGETVLSLYRRENPGHVRNKLIFHHRGNQYFLSEIWGGEGSAGMAMPATKAEPVVEVASNPSFSDTEVLIALK
jgi:hypothetical protein